ncbi:MAG TPA: TolC family protein [Gemmatimonadales bacterium]
MTHPTSFVRRDRLARGAALLLALALCAPSIGAQDTVAVPALAPPAAPLAGEITLQDAVERAREHGLPARAALSAREAARERERAFDATFLPRLTLSGDAMNLNRSFSPLRLPTGETRFIPQRNNQSVLTAGIVQPLPWTGGEVRFLSQLARVDEFGEQRTRSWQSTPFLVELQQGLFRPRTLRWSRMEQDAQLEVAERQYLEAREEIALATANAFFDLYAAQLSLDNAAANASVNDTLYTLNQGRYQVGKIGENDLLQSELALLRARAALDGARLERERTAAALRRLVGLPDGQPIAAAAPAPPGEIVVDPALAVAEALRNSSQVQSSELQRVRADRAVVQARLDNGFNADITASVGVNQTADEFDAAYASPLTRQRLTVGVEMPLMQWGAGRAAVGAARAERERVESTARASREELEESARFAALGLAQAQRVLAISAKADTVASRRFDVAKNRYVIGRIGIGELYIAQSEKDGALREYVQALRGYWAAYYRLRRITLYDFETKTELR